MASSDRSALFEVRHWVVTGALGAEFTGLMLGIDRLMTANFAIDEPGRQLLQLRYRTSTHVAELNRTEHGFAVSSVEQHAGDLSVTPAPRGLDARRSLVFDLLDPGTEIVVEMYGEQATMVLHLLDGREITLNLLAWNVPFASRAALIVHEHSAFYPLDTEPPQGLQQSAFARDGATGTIVFSRYLDSVREFFDIHWNTSGFEVAGPFDFTPTSVDLQEFLVPPPTPPAFIDKPIHPGDSFAVILNEDHTLDVRNTTQGWDYLLTPVGIAR